MLLSDFESPYQRLPIFLRHTVLAGSLWDILRCYIRRLADDRVEMHAMTAARRLELLHAPYHRVRGSTSLTIHGEDTAVAFLAPLLGCSSVATVILVSL
jgi:hypothetical protein